MSLESGCRERLLQTADGKQAVALLDSWEQRIVELEEWKKAAGWREDGFGPQTPAEVAVFQREAEHVNGQVAALEISKARAELATCQAAREEAMACIRMMLKANEDERSRHEATKAHLSRSMQGEADALAEITRLKEEIRTELAIAQGSAKEALQNLDDSEAEVKYLKQQLERYWRLFNTPRRFAFLWKEHAKRLLATVRELEREGQVAADLLEQREDAYKLLWESYEREQRMHAIYKESAEDCIRAMQGERDQLQPMLKVCDECFEQCQGEVRFSTVESDHYWELAERLMELTSKRLETPIERKPADPDDPNPGV